MSALFSSPSIALLLRTLSLATLVLLPTIQAQNKVSLRDLILERDDLELFRKALERSNLLEGILADTTGVGNEEHTMYTVLAPTDDVIRNHNLFSTYMEGIEENPPRWKHHILRSARHHILDAVSLTQEELFDNQYDAHYSLEAVVEIDHFFNKIGGVSIVEADMQASNGYLHIVDGVIEAPLMEHSFAALTEQPEYGPDWLDRVSLLTIVDFTKGIETYNQLKPYGQTHVGCRIRALNRIGLFYLPQCINGGPPTTIKYSEFLNESWIDRTIHDFLEYTLIDDIYYNIDIPNRYEELIRAANNCSDMWVTKSASGKLCFNDGCVVETPNSREYFASNGYGYVVDKCIVCSGVAMLVNYAAEFTKHRMRDVSQFFIASEWNLRNLSLSVGDGGPVTLFACSDPGFSIFNLEDVTRLASDKWKPHQWDLLRHNMLQGIWTEQDFIDKWMETRSPYNLESLAGQNVTIDYDETRQVVTVDGGDLWYPNIKGVDGLTHFVTVLPVPLSVTHTVYDFANEDPNYSGQIGLIDSVFLTQNMKRLLPLTAMYAPNEKWDNIKIAMADISKVMLENHLIENLAWCKDLVAAEGTKVDTLNGQLWTMSVNEDGKPCFESKIPGGPSFKSCVVVCDILARNGIVHYLDNVMVFETPETFAPRGPSVPTFSRPSVPTYFNDPSPSNANGLARPTFFGPTSPAYAPIDNRPSASSAVPRFSTNASFGAWLATAIAAVWGALCL